MIWKNAGWIIRCASSGWWKRCPIRVRAIIAFGQGLSWNKIISGAIARPPIPATGRLTVEKGTSVTDGRDARNDRPAACATRHQFKSHSTLENQILKPET